VTVRSRVNRMLIYLVVIAGCFVMLYPLLWLLVSSFKDNTEIFRNTSLIPEQFTLQNYVIGWRGVSGVTFTTFFLNSFYVVGLAVIGTVVSCSMAGYAFARLRFSGKKFFFTIMLAMLMLPFHVTLIPQYILFNRLGWINTYLPLFLPQFLATQGFFVFLLVQFIRSIPREIDQSAQIDGCGPIRTYLYLIMPLSVPALMTTLILQFIWKWNDFFSPLLYLSELRKFTVSLALRMFVDAMGGSSWGALFAMSVLSLVPVFLAFIIFQGYLIEGITTGSVKG
jgi:pectin-derived oligosaccharide transport system permease protein